MASVCCFRAKPEGSSAFISIFVIDPKCGKKYQFASGDLRHIDTAEIAVKQKEYNISLREVEEMVK